MANTQQAFKRTRQNEKRRMRNRWQLSRMRTALKTVLKTIASGDTEAAQTQFKEATTLVDRLASRGIIHKNKASRFKSRINAKIKQLAQSNS